MTASSAFCLFRCLLLLAGGVSVVSGFTPVTYPARVYRVSSECGQYDLLQDEQLTEALKQIKLKLGTSGCNPPRNRSCQEILHCFPSAPSGYYQITAPNGSLVQVYCDMEGTNCGGEGGWMRVAYVNMYWCYLPSGTDTANPLRTDSLWQNQYWWSRMSEHSVLHSRTELLSSICGQLFVMCRWLAKRFLSLL